MANILSRGMTVKISDFWPKIQCSFPKQEQYIYILPEKEDTIFHDESFKVPLIWSKLIDVFEEMGKESDPNYSSAQAAQDWKTAYYAFFEAAKRISEEGKYPFRLFIQNLDVSKLPDHLKKLD